MSTPPFVTLPKCVNHTMIGVGDNSLATLQTSNVDASCRVLLVPGFTGSKEDFLAILEPLHAAGLHAVAYDQVGQFESFGPADPAAYTLSALADDVVAVARRLWPDGPRPHLVGHSLGGLVARRAAIGSPADFSSVTLMASGPVAIPEHRRPELHALRAALPETDLATVWELRQEWERRNGAEPSSPEVTAFLRARWLANNPLALTAKALILLEESDRTTQLAGTGVPCAVLYGTDDDVWSPAQQSAMARELGALEVRIEHAGHSPAADQPRATAAALVGIWRRLGGLEPGPSGYDQFMTVRAALLAGTAAPRDARRLVADQVAEWGLDDISDDLRLIASELVTNALIHTNGPVEIGLSTGSDHVRIEVSDPSRVAPEVVRADPEDDHGRGLAIVASLSRDWGVEYHPHGKTVWADVAISSPA